MRKEIKICVLCGVGFTEWGNNPAPLADKGQCCDDCNETRVIPARFQGQLSKPLADKLEKENQ